MDLGRCRCWSLLFVGCYVICRSSFVDGSLLVDHGPWSMSLLISLFFVGYVISSWFVIGRPWTLVNVVVGQCLLLGCYVIRRS